MRRFTVYEHETLKVGSDKLCDQDKQFSEPDMQLFSRNHEKFKESYSLVHNGIRTRHLVGVLQIGHIQLEILPKVTKDHTSEDEKGAARKLLNELLLEAGYLKHKFPHRGEVSIQSSVLDMVIEAYLTELEHLLARGLIKRYRKQDGNLYALKGKLLVGEHLKRNFFHKERFYTRHSVYDFDHALNQVLLCALNEIPGLTGSGNLKLRSQQLQFQFPDYMEPLTLGHGVLEKKLSQIIKDRKSASFDYALLLAELILRHLSSKPEKGGETTIALLFDMNKVFENWLRESLRRLNYDASGRKYPFLLEITPDGNNETNTLTLNSDIVIDAGNAPIIIDAKWKSYNDTSKARDNTADLRQVYTYAQLTPNCKIAGLVFPRYNDGDSTAKQYLATHREEHNKVRLFTTSINLLGTKEDRRSNLEKLVGELQNFHNLPMTKPA